MATGVPLANAPRIAGDVLLRSRIKAREVESQLPVFVSPIPVDNPKVVYRDELHDRPCDGFKECQMMGHEVPSCPPPTRSVTPMLSLYATVKLSNIRELPQLSSESTY